MDGWRLRSSVLTGTGNVGNRIPINQFVFVFFYLLVPLLVKLVYPILNSPVLESIKQPWIQDVFLWFPCVVSAQKAGGDKAVGTNWSVEKTDTDRHWLSLIQHIIPFYSRSVHELTRWDTCPSSVDTSVINQEQLLRAWIQITNPHLGAVLKHRPQLQTRRCLIGTRGIAQIVKPHPSSGPTSRAPTSKHAQTTHLRAHARKNSYIILLAIHLF